MAEGPEFRKILILVEGQTEERFVKDLLRPLLAPRMVYAEPVMVSTGMANDGRVFKGGVSTYSKIKGDLQKLLGDSSARLVTTMLDLYALPDDTPGMKTIQSSWSGEKKAAQIEEAVAADLKDNRFKAYLMVHEFEGMLFSNTSALPAAMPGLGSSSQLERIRNSYRTPEDINDGKDTHPSKRIAQLFPGYQKALHGPNTLSRIGLDVVRRECPHFSKWMEQLESV